MIDPTRIEHAHTTTRGSPEFRCLRCTLALAQLQQAQRRRRDHAARVERLLRALLWGYMLAQFLLCVPWLFDWSLASVVLAIAFMFVNSVLFAHASRYGRRELERLARAAIDDLARLETLIRDGERAHGGT